jgi:hypothetical protein
MITGLKRRLKKIEDQYGSRWGDTVAAAGRITRAVLTVLRRPKRSGKGNVMREGNVTEIFTAAYRWA